jgi:hypothetical protein
LTTFFTTLDNFSKLKNALLDYAKLQDAQFTRENQLDLDFIDRLLERADNSETHCKSLALYVNGAEKDYKEMLDQLPKRRLSDSVIKTLKLSDLDKLPQAAEEPLSRNISKLLKIMAEAMKSLESDLVMPVIEQYTANLPIEKIAFYKKGDVAISKFQSFDSLSRFQAKFAAWFQSMRPTFSGIKVTLTLMNVFSNIANTYEKSKEFKGHSEIYSRRDKFMLYHPDSEHCLAKIKDVYAVLMLDDTIFALAFNRIKRGFQEAMPEPHKPTPTKHVRVRSSSCSSFFGARKIDVASDVTKSSSPPKPGES